MRHDPASGAIVDGLAKPIMRPLDDAAVLAHDLPLRGNHDAFRIDPKADRPVGEGGRHAVAVALQMDEAGRRDPLGVFDEAVEEARHRHQEPCFLGPDVLDRSRPETMGDLLPQFPAALLQPVVQGLQRWKARHWLP